MELHANTLGHVAFAAIPATAAMESAEEAYETDMLRCRYGRSAFACARISLGALLNTDTTFHNPSTLRDLALIYDTNLDQVFAHWGKPRRH